MICTNASLESLRKTRDRAAAEFERKIDNMVISGIAKSIFLERLRSRRMAISTPVRPEHRVRHMHAKDQVRRTGKALGTPTCCGEPRRLYTVHMLEALEIILHRKGLK